MVYSLHPADFLRIKEVAIKFGVKAIARIGSIDDDVMSYESLSRETSTPEKRANLEKQLTYYVDTYGLDGYVLFWPLPGCPNVRGKYIFYFS